MAGTKQSSLRPGDKGEPPANPSGVEYVCSGCGHRQRHTSTWCPRCGQTVTERPLRQANRFGMDHVPEGFEPLPVDPETQTPTAPESSVS